MLQGLHSMAGRGKRKLISLTASVSDNGGSREEEGHESSDSTEEQTWSELPLDLLQLIMSRLELLENIRASAVCKSWLHGAKSVRPVVKPPWLMSFPKPSIFPRSKDSYEIYDPSEDTTYTLDLPEIASTTVCYSKDGWLLMRTLQMSNLYFFFFNPFTREVRDLPRPQRVLRSVAFSSAPTSSNCWVFMISENFPFYVRIITCHVGATEWTTKDYEIQSPFILGYCNKIVFSDGLFYCHSVEGRLGTFDPVARVWNILPVRPPKCPALFLTWQMWKMKYLAENQGEIFLVYVFGEKPVVYKLNRQRQVWEVVRRMRGVTIFASLLTCESRSELPSEMKNRVYFSKVGILGRPCVAYSVDEKRYYPRKQWHDWGVQQVFNNSIWIKTPENVKDII